MTSPSDELADLRRDHSILRKKLAREKFKAEAMRTALQWYADPTIYTQPVDARNTHAEEDYGRLAKRMLELMDSVDVEKIG